MAAVPIYMGADEVQGIYFGADEVSEMYLGTELVYQSGPFSGLKITPKQIKILSKYATTGYTQKIYVKSSESWSLTSNTDWFTMSPTTGTGTGEKEEVTITITSLPSADTTCVISATSANYSASTDIIYMNGYGIPDNEIWYATNDETIITAIGKWNVCSSAGTNMASSCDFSTYGKFVFPHPIAYVKGDLNQTSGGWTKLTELGLPKMDNSKCIGANDFGLRYINANMPYWTRVYGDYEFINSAETIAYGADGCGLVAARGVTGTCIVPEGVKAMSSYCMARTNYSVIEFPTTLTGVTGYANGLALGDYCLEDSSSLTAIKYKTQTAPPVGNAVFNRVTQEGIAYYPSGGSGYDNTKLKPNNFVMTPYQ